MFGAVRQPHHGQSFFGPAYPLLLRDAGVDGGKLGVLQRGGARQQVEALEDKADLAVAYGRQLTLVQ